MSNAVCNLDILLRQVVVGVRRRQVVVVSSGQVRLFLFHGLRGIAVVGAPICLRFFFGCWPEQSQSFDFDGSLEG